MKISEILRQNIEIQQKRILEQPTMTLKEFFKNSKKMCSKVLVFPDDIPLNLLKTGMTIRKFAYLSQEKKWMVSDQNLLTGLEEVYETHFNSKEFQENFNWIFNKKGYLFDPK